MRRIVLLAAALAFGCDDPEVTNKVADVLQYGATSAAVDCFIDPPSVGTFTNPDARGISARLLFDGSLFLTVIGSQRSVIAGGFIPRGYDQTVVMVDTFAGEGTRDEVVDGVWSVEITDGGGTLDDPPYSLTLPYQWIAEDLNGPNCTGFNLEAFGVE